MPYLPLSYKHGQDYGKGKKVWVGPDGLARPVSNQLFEQLEEMTRRNKERADRLQKKFDNDTFGVAHEVAEFVYGIKFIVENMTNQEILEYYGKTGEERDLVLEKAQQRISKEYLG